LSYIIGGSGSSGTTLLRRTLDNHPEVFSGPELALFNKERLYQDWQKWKYFLISDKRRFSTDGWFPYLSHNLYHESYGWKNDEIARLIEESSTFLYFVDKFFDRPLKASGKKIWVEKTPSNTYGFSSFLRLSVDHKVIHMARNPYDAVASLVKRGMTPIFAAGIWVYNNSAGSAASGIFPERYFFLRYEDLVESYTEVTTSLLSFMNASAVDLSNLGKRNDQNKRRAKGIPSWNNNPADPISKRSVGSFFKLEQDAQETIKQALHLFRIRERVMREKGFLYNSASQLCDCFGYEYFHPRKAAPVRHIRDMFLDFSKRSYRGYSTGWLHYPGKLVF
jgi:hypothetical protein